jgi:hypothetical protein
MNTVLWGFSDPRIYPAILQLQNEQHIEIKAWIGDTFACPHCTHNAWEITKNQVPFLEYTKIDETLYNSLFAHLYQFMDMYSRGFDAGDKTIHDYLNMFNMFINFFYQLLTKNKVQVVMFYNIPHDGSDFLLYQVAKSLGIKTILFYQTLFPNKFFFVDDLTDFGDFSNIQPFIQLGTIHVSNKYEKDIFYMKKNPLIRTIKQEDIDKWKKSMSKIPHKIRQLPQRITMWPRKQLIKLLTFDNKIKYKQNNNKYAINEIKTDTPFVYFALHLQPELTTSALGNRYVDQILAVEKLRQMLPEHWNIYVKENPKQTENMRSSFFYDRLQRIKNTYLVSKDVDTYFLLKESAFPATITGTLGWEAVTGGKNVLIFGSAWYKTLPGVFSYRSDLDLNEILNYRINHKELEEKLSELMGKMADGVIDITYTSIVENFSHEGNQKTVANSLKDILKSIV